jgi:8-demethyl-8-alpha-L-rhamnosyltetracenomycin-C 2'-O-methyltransferase
MDLAALYEKYGTNKLWHGYAPFYSKLFDSSRNTVQNFLEIGISTGESLRSWRDYFPNATIYGIDITYFDRAILDEPRIKCLLADQSDVNQLSSAMNTWGNPTFDSIIDDGGHTVRQQRVSIEYLWKFLKPGGYYIIEDLHTNIPNMKLIHPHLNSESKHIDETPTIHDKIYSIMAGDNTLFSIDVKDIDEIYYFNTPNKLSLSCAFKKHV